MGVRLFGNRVHVWCLAGIDYKMPELGSDDLVMGSGLCPWSLIVVLHVLLNLGIEAALMCHDSLKLPNCARNPHVGSSISVVKVPYATVGSHRDDSDRIPMKIGCAEDEVAKKA
ncbi:hypothetical protein M9H77_21538 [Catharanthus roseus]|uniref:Uncharacterized protein n=1 Tax=Catharanthus roseus TaxID=4058 RepID=A0ACC0AMV7_CATRO|nr:hypothetical protein M9H77_21538 [Catharanthus roseus]